MKFLSNNLRTLFFLILPVITLSCNHDESEPTLEATKTGEIRLISSKGIFPNINLRAAVLNGDFAYLTERSWGAGVVTGGVYVYSLLGLEGITTKNIVEQSFISIPHQTVNMVRSGTTLYVGGSDGISVLDITNGASPVLVKTLNDTATFSLKIYGQSLYAIEAQSVTAYDISNPLNPNRYSTINAVGFNAAYANGYLYSGRGISKSFKVTDANSKQFIASISLQRIPYHIDIFQGDLVVLSANSKTTSLRLYSIADPVNPVFLDEIIYSKRIYSFAVDSQHIVISGWELGQILQVTTNGKFEVFQDILNGSATNVDGFPYTAAIDSKQALLSGDNYGLLHRF